MAKASPSPLPHTYVEALPGDLLDGTFLLAGAFLLVGALLAAAVLALAEALVPVTAYGTLVLMLGTDNQCYKPSWRSLASREQSSS